jgi:plasmid stabilization system protein ParE
MDEQFELLLLAPAQRELEEIARVHLDLVGPQSARRITDRIYSSLEHLKLFPEMGFKCRDKQLATAGYRTLVCGNYLCFYRQIGKYVFVHHIVDGRSDYPRLLSDLKAADDQQPDD